MYCGEQINTSRFLIPFPLNDENLLKSWLKNIGLHSNFKPHKTWRLCSDHFAKDSVQFCDKKLISKSIPTVFNKRIWYSCLGCGIHQYEENCPSFHTFPTKDAVLRKMWLKSVRSNKLVPLPTSLICSNHFDDDCFRNHERRKGYLKKSAVPTVFGKKTPKVSEKQSSESTELPVPSLRLYNLTDKQSSESLNLPLPPLKSENQSSDSTDLSVPSLKSENLSDNQSSESPDLSAPPLNSENLSSNFNNNNNNNTCNLTIDNINFEHIDVKQEILDITDVVYERNTTLKTVSADHNYYISLKKLKKKLLKVEEDNKKLKNINRINQQRISRMKTTISTLRDIISELKKSKTTCED